MRRKGSFIRIEAIREVRTSVATFGAGVVETLDAQRPVPADGEPELIYQMVFDDLDRKLETAQETLVSAEDAHTRARIRRSDLTRSSEKLTGELYDRQVATRRTLAGIYGPERGFELAAVEGSTPRTVGALVDQVDQTVKVLRQPEIEVPTVVVDGVEVTLDDVATGLQSSLDELNAVRADLDKSRKAVNETVIARTEAIEEYDRVFPWVARALESYFRLAGEIRLADRIRTSVRRVTRRQAVEPDGGEAGEPAADAPEAGGVTPVTETVEATAETPEA